MGKLLCLAIPDRRDLREAAAVSAIEKLLDPLAGAADHVGLAALHKVMSNRQLAS